MAAVAGPLVERKIARALVLGGSGFIGAPLVAALREDGVAVDCLVHRRPPPVAGVTAIPGSLDSFDWRTLERDLPDVIFHLARIAGRGGVRGAVTRVRNRMANERLAAWLAGLPRPPLLVYVGGTLAFGSHGDDEVTEETPLAPISFSRDYASAERPWRRALRGNDAPVILARPAWVLGPGSWFAAFYLRFMREEGAVPVYGAGDNWMSLVHVEDCARQLVHAARHAPPLAIVNVFVGAPLRQAELAAKVARASGLPLRTVSFDEMERRWDRAVREAFGFSARIGTVHGSLHRGFVPRHADLDRALAQLVAGAAG